MRGTRTIISLAAAAAVLAVSAGCGSDTTSTPVSPPDATEQPAPVATPVAPSWTPAALTASFRDYYKMVPQVKARGGIQDASCVQEDATHWRCILNFPNYDSAVLSVVATPGGGWIADPEK